MNIKSRMIKTQIASHYFKGPIPMRYFVDYRREIADYLMSIEIPADKKYFDIFDTVASKVNRNLRATEIKREIPDIFTYVEKTNEDVIVVNEDLGDCEVMRGSEKESKFNICMNVNAGNTFSVNRSNEIYGDTFHLSIIPVDLSKPAYAYVRADSDKGMKGLHQDSIIMLTNRDTDNPTYSIRYVDTDNFIEYEEETNLF